MKSTLAAIAVLATISVFPGAQAQSYVAPHLKPDGTFVRGHKRPTPAVSRSADDSARTTVPASIVRRNGPGDGLDGTSASGRHSLSRHSLAPSWKTRADPSSAGARPRSSY